MHREDVDLEAATVTIRHNRIELLENEKRSTRINSASRVRVRVDSGIADG